MKIESTLNELQMECLLGGYSNFCRIWTELYSHGIFFSISKNGSVTLFAMSQSGIVSKLLTQQHFIEITSHSPFIHNINGLMGKPSNYQFETHKLVEASIYARVLWANTVYTFGAIKDRLFDCCFEMGDGSKVASIVEFLQGQSIFENSFMKIEIIVNKRLRAEAQLNFW